MPKFLISLFAIGVLFACGNTEVQKSIIPTGDSAKKGYSAQDILDALDDTIDMHPYYFFAYMDHPDCVIAGSRMTLYADSFRWAIVLEKMGYENNGFNVMLELTYYGNCLQNLEMAAEGRYECNTKWIEIISPDELERYGSTPLVGSKLLVIREDSIFLPSSLTNDFISKYKTDDLSTEENQIKFIRYLADNEPGLLCATEDELRTCLPSDLPHLMTINEWYVQNYWFMPPSSKYGRKPSSYETFPLIAKVLESRDTMLYKPKTTPNTHWKNWPMAGQY